MLASVTSFVVATLLIVSIGIAGIGVWLLMTGARARSVVYLCLATLSIAFQAWASSERWIGGAEMLAVDYLDLTTQIALAVAAIVAAGGLLVVILRVTSSAVNANNVLDLAMLIIFLILGYGVVVWQSSLEKNVQRDPTQRTILTAAGFSARLIAYGEMGHPTALCFDDDGYIYISDVEGRIWRGAQRGDGTLGALDLLVNGLDRPLGLAWYNGKLYVSSKGRIDAYRLADSGDILAIREIIDGLPAGIYSYHQNNGITIGPDGRLYVGVGSTSDYDIEKEPFAAAILSMETDGSDLRVVATGLRNPYDLTFDSHGQLWATDNGPAREYPIPPPDELNAIVEGKHYGFPDTYGDDRSPHSEAVGPVSTFPPHSSADGVIAYTHDYFGEGFFDNLFVVTWRDGDLYRIEVRPASQDSGYLQRSTVFATGFLNPLALAVDPHGRLLVADYGTQAIYLIDRQ